MIDDYNEDFLTLQDGGSLFYKTYGNSSAHPILCMHGLTRNSKDFNELAEYLSDEFFVITADQRGRGESSYIEDHQKYTPKTYISDMYELIQSLNFKECYLIGTSMGGFMAMTMSAMNSVLFPKIVLNDCGPEIHQVGIDKISTYLGKNESFESIDEAVAILKTRHESNFPSLTDTDWKRYCTNNLKINEDHSYNFDYDQNIRVVYETAKLNLGDMWNIWEEINSNIFVIRGALSQLLSESTFKKMQAKENVISLEIPDTGHAPLLTSKFELDSIKAFLLSH